MTTGGAAAPRGARHLARLGTWSASGALVVGLALVPSPVLAEEPAPTAAADGSPQAEAALVEVVVQGQSEAGRLRDSAQAVTVIETRDAKLQSSDLGEIMKRTAGVGVRREGGLGSAARISLYGLTDEQIRFYEDDVPLDFMGFGEGMANLPVNLVERVEIYRGVVPIRFGADALGGVINVVTDGSDRPAGAAASYQVGSYGTYRATFAGRWKSPGGHLAGLRTFWDRAKNDYPVRVRMPNERGRLHPVTVRRFHDAYSARGASLELGVVRQPWAKALVLNLFTTSYRKDLPAQLQHDRALRGAGER